MRRKIILRSVVPVALIILAAIAFAVFEPIQVLPRIRLAPGYLLVDQSAPPTEAPWLTEARA